jgi:glycosyltransferase involved in cell wall biosynthesis
MSRPKVTIYTPSNNYGRFLAECVESVLAQLLKDWELLIVDDGSTDETAEVAAGYAARHPDRITVIRNETPRGLQACANLAIEKSRGEYIMRLDADDYLDEGALLVMCAYLDQHPDVGLVYPNYTYIDERGARLGVEDRKKIGTEAKLLDLPAHGACTLVRKRVLKSIGGYNENYNAQDGHELWLKVIHRYPVGNVSTPLFYYRQHGDSVSRDERRILSARQQITRDLVKKHEGAVKPRVAAIIPAKNTYRHLPDIVLRSVAGRPLIDYTLDTALGVDGCDAVMVSTDDPRVVDHCRARSGVLTHLRPEPLSRPQVHLSEVVREAVACLEEEHGVHPDILVVLNVHAPLCRPEFIRKAVDTLILYHADSAISVYEDYDIHFAHAEHGLVPLNKAMLQRIRLEREAIYVDNGAVKVLWRDTLGADDLYGRKVSHVVMPAEESVQIKKPHDLWLAEQLLLRRGGNVATGSVAAT